MTMDGDKFFCLLLLKMRRNREKAFKRKEGGKRVYWVEVLEK